MKEPSHPPTSSEPTGEAPSPSLDVYALLDLAPVISRDLQDRILHWSQGVQCLYGFAPEEALGQISHELLKTRFPRPLEHIRASLFASGRWKGELTHTRRDGSQIVVTSEWALQRDRRGNPCAILEVNQDITGLRLTEQSLRESEENLRRVFNSGVDGIILHTPDGTLLEVNQRFQTMYGVEFAPGSKLSVADLSSPSNPLEVMPGVWAKVMAGEEQRFLWKARRPRDGSEFDVEVFLTKIRLRQGEAILANVRDITERKRTAEQLRLQSAALGSAANAIIITGRDGLIQWVNPAFTALTGYSAQEALGKNPRLLKSGLQSDAFYRGMWQTVLAGRVWRGELVNCRKDGSLYTEDMTITPVTESSGEVTHFIAIKQDVTPRKQAEEALLRRNQRLSILTAVAEALLSSADTGIALDSVYDRMAEWFQIDGFVEFRLTDNGDAVEVVYCKTVAGARQPSITRLGLGEGIAGKVAQTRAPIVLANARASADPNLPFVNQLRANAYACEPLMVGERLLGALSFGSSTRNSFDAEEQDFFRTLANYVALAKERLRLTRELQAHARNLEQTVRERTAQLLEANANLQTFAYTAAHDLRSPLRSIRSFSTIAVEEYGAQLGPEGQMMLQKVMQSTDQMSRLLNDLLEYSKLNQAELRLEPVDLGNAVEEALVLLQEDIRSKGAHLMVERPLLQVIGHPATVTLVITNYVSNALKFLPSGIEPRVRIWSETAGNFIRLAVKDNGIGIEPNDREKLFQAFQRLHGKSAYPGTGLGLAIVRRAVERMGGQVGVDSEPNQGSCFWFELRQA